ncbi:DNA-directed RNA polymerases I, II and III (nucleomorph) [Lotharella oceanica]|uniref:DNA-directed RNA polymerases I, II and III n=1 Tax=Lotharella oceanica TaxID=641309 RepID=A0A060DHJ4_9EUKA|nr:DNA-directed RNA polymerases I, II and III [Lotharella oceanica]
MNKKDKTNSAYIEYICAKCGTINEINVDDEYICSNCLFRILYKKKTIGIKKITAI